MSEKSVILVPRPGIYHLHLDGSYASEALDHFVKEMYKFTNGDFCGHPEGYKHFEPLYHRIYKTESKSNFFVTWEAVEQMARLTGFIGYIEGEFIKGDELIDTIPFDDTIPVPFFLERRRLRGEPNEGFREAELHLVMDRDKSDPRLVKKLLDAGLYGAYIPDGDRIELVLTAQGFIRDIDPLIASLRDYLKRAGGTVHGQLFDERAVRYAIFNADHTSLPEIVDRIEWR